MIGVRKDVLELVTGWKAVEIVLKCFFIGTCQLIQMSVKRLWKGHRRKSAKNSQVELTVDSSIGRHCYIKIMGVKYHYVETGPKTGQKVLILGDAPETVNLWGPTWSLVVKWLADTDHHIITLDLRGTGASEGGSRIDLSPPRAVEELATLMSALGVTDHNPAVVIGFGIGGMLTWYLAHCHTSLISKFCVINAPHPNLYWEYPPAEFCHSALHFIQWPYFPERLLAEGELQGCEDGRWASSRARDWVGALHYVRGAAWWAVRALRPLAPPALLVGGAGGAAQLVASARLCAAATLRTVAARAPGPADPQLPAILMDFLRPKQKITEEKEALPRAGLVGRVLGAVAGRGRELTARLALPAQAWPLGAVGMVPALSS